MNEQPIVQTTSIFQMISYSGFLGVAAISLSLLVLVIAPILFTVAKSKRPFVIWLLKQSIIGNLISALLVFVSGMFKSAMTMGWNAHSDHAIRLFIANIYELSAGCASLITIALFLYILRVAFVFPGKLKE